MIKFLYYFNHINFSKGAEFFFLIDSMNLGIKFADLISRFNRASSFAPWRPVEGKADRVACIVFLLVRCSATASCATPAGVSGPCCCWPVRTSRRCPSRRCWGAAGSAGRRTSRARWRVRFWAWPCSRTRARRTPGAAGSCDTCGCCRPWAWCCWSSAPSSATSTWSPCRSSGSRPDRGSRCSSSSAGGPSWSSRSGRPPRACSSRPARSDLAWLPVDFSTCLTPPISRESRAIQSPRPSDATRITLRRPAVVTLGTPPPVKTFAFHSPRKGREIAVVGTLRRSWGNLGEHYARRVGRRKHRRSTARRTCSCYSLPLEFLGPRGLVRRNIRGRIVQVLRWVLRARYFDKFHITNVGERRWLFLRR